MIYIQPTVDPPYKIITSDFGLGMARKWVRWQRWCQSVTSWIYLVVPFCEDFVIWIWSDILLAIILGEG
jgi:hypothetical protein